MYVFVIFLKKFKKTVKENIKQLPTFKLFLLSTTCCFWTTPDLAKLTPKSKQNFGTGCSTFFKVTNVSKLMSFKVPIINPAQYFKTNIFFFCYYFMIWKESLFKRKI